VPTYLTWRAPPAEQAARPGGETEPDSGISATAPGAYARFVDIVEFLSERIREDEAAARKILSDRTLSESGKWYEHRLLLECEAKKRVIRIVESARQTALATMVSDPFEEESRWIPEAIEWTTRSLKALALPYADHPDFEQDWL
jgi:hypothetical protein